MEIEFDPEKDAANRAKHGEALILFLDMDLENALILPDDRFEYGEARERIYGLIGGRLHVAAITRRGGVIRVISLRKANKREVQRYDER